MSKKSRRTKAKHRAKSAKTIKQRQPQLPKPVATKPQISAEVSPKIKSPAPQYQYVLPDLRYIGILAGSIITILIVLSFVLG